MKRAKPATVAAAAILLGTAAASAETLKNIKPERPPAPLRNAPAEKIAPPIEAPAPNLLDSGGNTVPSRRSENERHDTPETTGQSPHSDR